MSQYYTFENAFTVESLRYGGYLLTSSEYISLDRCYGSRAFIHVVRGYVSIKSDLAEDHTHILQPGDTLFLTPTVSYKIRDFVDTSQTSHQIGFIFLLSFECNSPLIENFNQRLCFTRQDERHYLSSISTELEQTFDFSRDSGIQLVGDAPFASGQLIKNYLELFLISCYRRENLADLSSRQTDLVLSPRKEDLCNQIIGYLHRHISEKITLNDIAGSLNLSVSMIERSFSEYTGSSIINYISQLRVDGAKRLISEGGHSFTEIAELMGFDNVHYFSNRFKRFAGMTPTQYAKSLTASHGSVKKYVITYMEDPDWSRVPSLQLEDLHWGNVSNVGADYQIVWNRDGLLIHAIINESHVLARYDKPNQPIYLDSYTEFFFKPIDGHSRYFNVGINPNGAMYCGIGEYSHDRIRVLMDSENEGPYYHVRILRDDSRWEAFFTIPVGLIRLFFSNYSFEEGMQLYGNCCKCVTDGMSTHYMSWTPLPAQTRSFHRPEAFGIMTLGPRNDKCSDGKM